MISFNNFTRQYHDIQDGINVAISRVLNSGWYILGKEVQAFENEFAAYNGVKFCSGVASGTEAIALSLMAIDIQKDDEVITSNLTAFPTITGIMQAGARPVVVDITDNDGLLDCSKIVDKITNKTKAIIPVHLYGQSCDMKSINQIATNYGLKIIEDCAQATGATYNGQKVGSLGICGTFSFYPTKNLGAYGDGGAIITNDEDIFQKIIYFRNYGQTSKYYHDMIGINSRLDELQAAVLREKLRYLDNWNAKRIELANYYKKNIRTVKWLDENDYGTSVYHLFIIKSEKRNSLLEYLEANEIQSLIHYPLPVNRQKAFLWQKDEAFVNSKRFADQILSIPLYPELKLSEIDTIINCINNHEE